MCSKAHEGHYHRAPAFPALTFCVSPQDVKSAGVAESAVLEAVPTLLNADLADFTYDSFQEIDGPMFPFTTTPPGMKNGRNPEDEAVAGAVGCHEQQPAGESASSEEKGEAEDESCEMTWKKSRRLAGGLMRFSINLLREAQVESNGTNVILSPLSIALALSHLALGNFLITKASVPALPCAPSWRHQEPMCKMQRLNTAPST